jgi:hypothetical protein
VQVRQAGYARCSRRGDPLYDRRVRCDPTLRGCEVMLQRFARSLLHASEVLWSCQSQLRLRQLLLYARFSESLVDGSATLFCDMCGTPISADAMFCPSCGRELRATTPPHPARTSSMRFCSRCGREIPGAARFCAYCGTSVTAPSLLRHPSAPSPSNHRILEGASSLLRWRFYSWESL